jgi:hypothetical protein
MFCVVQINSLFLSLPSAILLCEYTSVYLFIHFTDGYLNCYQNLPIMNKITRTLSSVYACK